LSEHFHEYGSSASVSWWSANTSSRCRKQKASACALERGGKNNPSAHRSISIEEAQEVKKIEKGPITTSKPSEYYIKKTPEGTSMQDISEWVHFGLTSEDIN